MTDIDLHPALGGVRMKQSLLNQRVSYSFKTTHLGFFISGSPSGNLCCGHSGSNTIHTVVETKVPALISS